MVPDRDIELLDAEQAEAKEKMEFTESMEVWKKRFQCFYSIILFETNAMSPHVWNLVGVGVSFILKLAATYDPLSSIFVFCISAQS